MKELSGVHVLVTGGAGFLGSEIVRQFAGRGASTSVLDDFSSGKRSYVESVYGVDVVEGSVCNEDTARLALKDRELVVHAAALPFIPDSYYRPHDFFQVNVTGTLTVIMAAMRSESVERFVHISSSEVYGTAKYVPMDEEHPTLPHSTYAASKLAGERAVFAMGKEHGFPVVIVRPFNIYGPNITQPYIVPEIAFQLIRGNSILELGNVESRRDLTYVSDTANGIVLCSTVKEAVGETINLGSGSDLSVRELAHLMASIRGKKIQIRIDETRFRPFDVERMVCNSGRAREILGWELKVGLREGLEKTMRWIEDNGVELGASFRGWPRYYRGSK